MAVGVVVAADHDGVTKHLQADAACEVDRRRRQEEPARITTGRSWLLAAVLLHIEEGRFSKERDSIAITSF